MAQFHWHPEGYLDAIRAEVPEYERLQDETVAATEGGEVERILELGTGTGETARRLLRAHPRARLLGIDASPDMLAVARQALERQPVEVRVGRLEDPVPAGPFDRVVSVLCVHHLDGPGKADLFRRLAEELSPGGRLVVGDVVVPEDPADVVTPIDWDYDLPSGVEEQLGWLRDAGLHPHVAWSSRDLAVLAARA
jgi:tRNA (cmo5U34)-methyltransferase